MQSDKISNFKGPQKFCHLILCNNVLYLKIVFVSTLKSHCALLKRVIFFLSKYKNLECNEIFLVSIVTS